MSIALQRMMFEINYLMGISLLLVTAVAMVVRSLHRQTPVFFCYVVVADGLMATTYLLVHFGNPYVAWYSIPIGNAICILLEFGILIEVFQKLFASYAGIRHLASRVMLLTAAVLVVISALTAARFHDVALFVPIQTFIYVLTRSLRLIQLGLILSLLLVSHYLHLRWKNFIFGIVLGFGFYALLVLAGNVITAYYGKTVGSVVEAADGLEYSATLVIWLVYALQREAATTPIVSLPSHELEKWDTALSRLLRQNPSSSIPAADDKFPDFVTKSEQDSAAKSQK